MIVSVSSQAAKPRASAYGAPRAAQRTVPQPERGGAQSVARAIGSCRAGAARRSGAESLSFVRAAIRRDRLAVSCQAAQGSQMTIAITGATGLVGSRLTAKLVSQGHKVRVLTRDVGAARSKLQTAVVAGAGQLEYFPPAQWRDALAGATGVVNLAGEPIANRWTPEVKRLIKASRVGTTQALVEALAALPAGSRPAALVSASAVGFYGTSGSATFNEDSASGADYLAEVCRDWESAAQGASKLGVRVAILRIGIVLARQGGALGKMLPVFQVFAGGPLGSGRQWMSWIHRDDLVDLIIEALRNAAYSGVYNATAPKPVRMSELCSALGVVTGRPSWLPVPDFALQALLSEGASVVLDGQRVVPARTQAAGFKFRHADIADALRNLLA